LIDEDLPPRLAAHLRAAGHQAEHVYDVGLSTQPDPVVFRYAQAHQQTLITEDRGFGDTRYYAPPHAGIILIELPQTLLIDVRVRLIVDSLAPFAGQQFDNALVIIEPNKVRVRR